MEGSHLRLFCMPRGRLYSQHYNTMLESSDAFELSDVCIG